YRSRPLRTQPGRPRTRAPRRRKTEARHASRPALSPRLDIRGTARDEPRPPSPRPAPGFPRRTTGEDEGDPSPKRSLARLHRPTTQGHAAAPNRRRLRQGGLLTCEPAAMHPRLDPPFRDPQSRGHFSIRETLHEDQTEQLAAFGGKTRQGSKVLAM